MKSKIETAIETLSKKAADAERAGDAQQYAQAALNLAHALSTIENISKSK